MTTFTELPLSYALQQKLAAAQFTQLMPIQERAIEPALEIIELRSAAFRDDAKAWFCLSRQRTIPAQSSTRHD